MNLGPPPKEMIKTQSLPEEPSHALFFLAGGEDVGGAD